MCISSDAYVSLKVSNRLRSRGVDPRLADAVGRKVARRYREKREAAYAAYLEGREPPPQLRQRRS